MKDNPSFEEEIVLVNPIHLIPKWPPFKYSSVFI